MNPLGEIDEPQEETADYLGRPAPTSFTGQPALPVGGPVGVSSGPVVDSEGMAAASADEGMVGGGGGGGPTGFPPLGAFLSVLRDAGFSEAALADWSSSFKLGPVGQSFAETNFPVEGMAPNDLGGSLLQGPPVTAGDVAPPILDPELGGAFTENTMSALEGIEGLSLTADQGQSLMTTLGEFSSYIPYLVAAINSGMIAAGDLQDDQKILGVAGSLGQLAATLGISAAATGFGATAGMAAGIAAPVAMGLGFTVRHFMEQMEDIPHDVREQMDVALRTPVVEEYYRGIDEAPDLDTLMDFMIGHSAPAVGGGTYPSGTDRMAFIPRFMEPGQAPGGQMTEQFIGRENPIYPVASREDILARPELVTIFPQLGVADQYLQPWQDALSGLARDRLALFARAERGDPMALASLALIRARAGAAQKERGAVAARRRLEEEGRLATVPWGGGETGEGAAPAGGQSSGVAGSGEGP